MIPKEIGQLTKLHLLHIEGNPIISFDKNVINNLSDSLINISFGSKELTEWPEAIGLLKNTFQITIQSASFETIPDDAFQKLTCLGYLTLSSTRLRSLPVSMQRTSMVRLDLDNNEDLKADGLKPDAFRHLSYLRQFYINNGSMETLPPIFKDLSVLTWFGIENTPLKYIDDSVFPKNFSNLFFKFSSDYSLFESVPSFLSATKSLTNISLSNNRISYINDTDFAGLNQLIDLRLSGNPLKGISDHAFKGCPRLRQISLDHTELTTIPKALRSAYSLRTVDLTGCKIVCSCENLGWMKYWNLKDILFRGSCCNIQMDIYDYIRSKVPRCWE